MEYKTADTIEMQVFDVETHDFENDEAAKAVNELASLLTPDL